MPLNPEKQARQEAILDRILNSMVQMEVELDLFDDEEPTEEQLLASAEEDVVHLQPVEIPEGALARLGGVPRDGAYQSWNAIGEKLGCCGMTVIKGHDDAVKKLRAGLGSLDEDEMRLFPSALRQLACEGKI